MLRNGNHKLSKIPQHPDDSLLNRLSVYRVVFLIIYRCCVGYIFYFSGPPEVRKQKSARQTFLIPANVNSIPLATTGPCFTGKGVLGKCTSFRQCYPYFKVPELNNFESWILGMYDTCSYYTAQGRQVKTILPDINLLY